MIANGTKLKHLLFNSPVPEGWEVKTVDQIKADEKHACCAGPFGSSISAKFFVDEGVPVIRGNNLTIGGESFVDNGFVYVSEDKARSFPGQHVKTGDLVFTCWGTLGQVGLIPDNSKFDEYIISNKQLKLRVNSEVCNSNFLYYYFSLPQMVRHINDIAIGSAVPGINLGLLKSIKIALPPKETQDQIVALVSSISGLIENNKRRITLLENMTEEIYREWFVRFRFPGWQGAEFEKGLPVGWRTSGLGEIAKFVMGQSPKSEFYNRKGDGLPFHQGVGTFGQRFPVNEVFCSVPGREARAGDVLFSVRAPVGRLNVALENMVIGRGLAAVRHRRDCQAYLYYLLSMVFSDEDIIGNGAIFNAVGKDELLSFKVLTPHDELIDAFEELAKPIDDQITGLIGQIEVLEKTKAQLLPRLISGKLSVENLDIQFPPSMQNGKAESPVEAVA